MTERKQCPFCAAYDSYTFGNPGHCYVKCAGCLATGPAKTSASEAIEAWNKAHTQSTYQPDVFISAEKIKMRFELVKAALPAVYDAYTGHCFIAEKAIEIADAVLAKMGEK